MIDDRRTPTIIWTETLLDVLVAAVARQKEEQSSRILRGIGVKGFKKAAVVEYANKRLDPNQVKHLHQTCLL